LCSDQKATVVLTAAGDIEKPDQNPFGADADGVVEISRYAFSDEGGSDAGTGDRGKDGWNRFHYGGGSSVGAEAGNHGRRA
jgi:hypothetical protein